MLICNTTLPGLPRLLVWLRGACLLLCARCSAPAAKYKGVRLTFGNLVID